MKAGIHPEYVECNVTCGCGNTFVTGATTPTLNVEICSVCHPFYTGKQKFVDRAGRVDRFTQRYQWNEESLAEKSQQKKSRRGKLERVSIGVPKFKKKKEDEEEEAAGTRRGRRTRGAEPAPARGAPASDSGAGASKGSGGEGS